MKKIICYFLLFVIIIFIVPSLLAKPTKAVGTDINEENKNESKSLQEGQDNSQEQRISNEDNKEVTNNQNNKYSNIKLLHTKTNEVEEIGLEEYIKNVVSGEMPADFEIEALKAQAIVARTYTLYKINDKKHGNADICDDSKCCQAWISKEGRLAKWEESERENRWRKIEQCVEETKGKVITYNNQPINAFFHSNSGGTTEIPKEVWGGDNFPYLQVVQTAGEEGYTQYSSEVSYTNNDLLIKLKEKYSDIQIDFNSNEDIKILEYTGSGRVRTIKFGNHNLSGVETRNILGLKSANFEIIKNAGIINFKVKGYGHGVGMSQTGADSLAKEGKNAEDIIKHFYKDVEIKDINSL